jgi:hypothetical protein
VSSIVFFIDEFYAIFFSNPADVRHHLYRRPSLSAAQPGATRRLITLWETSGTRDLFLFAQGGLLWAQKGDPSKK